jgi:hypothetical protein
MPLPKVQPNVFLIMLQTTLMPTELFIECVLFGDLMKNGDSPISSSSSKLHFKRMINSQNMPWKMLSTLPMCLSYFPDPWQWPFSG